MDFKLKKSILNFSVKTAETVPTNPGKENDIVVISSVSMKNWILTTDAPGGAPRNDGDVWLRYSVTGNTFNAVKQNAMMLAITSVKQYFNSEWVDVPAVTYRNGEWVKLAFVLWDAAANYENTAILGSKGFYITAENSGAEGYGSLSKSQSGLVLNSNKNTNIVAVSHDNAIDFSGVTKVEVTWSGGNPSETYQGIGVFKSTNKVYSSDAIKFLHKDNTIAETATLDVSDIKEKAYVVLLAFNGALTVNKIELK